jgi:Putative beta-barrel porin-2, OmpL-like. bbp2
MRFGVYSILGSLLVAGFLTSPFGVRAEDEADDANFLTKHTIGPDLSNETGLSFRGWLSQGITFNGEDQASNFNGPLSFNDRDDEYQMNQLSLVIERAIDKTSDSFDLGGRFDLMYGTDAAFTQALGWDDKIVGDRTSRFYKMAMPQLYAEMLVPIGSGLTIKAGHFYTLIGYEVVTAPDNFFYSHAFTMQYGEPFTHTGVLASYSLSDAITATAGVTKGWDNVSDSDKSAAFLGSLAWSQDGTGVTLAVTSGDEAPGLNRTMYSLVLSQEFCEKWKFVLHHDYGYQEAGSPSGAAAQWYGVNNYLTYEIDDALSVGARAEWFRDDDGVRVAGLRSGSAAAPGDFFGATLGLNYQVTGSFKIRPEVRFDYQRRSDSLDPAAFGDGGSINQWTTALDGVLTF